MKARRAGAEVEIDVIDDGPGIPEQQLEHIFERFSRGDAGETQRVGGTGLGLAISKSLIELHGGTIDAESTPGQRLDLPHPPAGDRPRPGGGDLMARILIADDSETILLLLRTRLEMEGHEVETAADGQEVVDKVQRRRTHRTSSCSTR